MRRLFVLLLLLVAGGGLAGWLATQPVGDAAAIQPSDTAATAARAKVAAAFAAGDARAFLTRRPQAIRIVLSDEELTSLAAGGAGDSGSAFSSPTVRGTADGVFQATADTAVGGVTVHVLATATVAIDPAGNLHLTLRSLNVGLLPLPAGWLQSQVDDAAASNTVPIPPGISGIAIQAVGGGAVVTATAAPVG